MMKRILVSLALAPLLLFQVNALAASKTPTVQVQTLAKAPLGNLEKFRVIAADTLKIAKTGNLKAAEKRITDLESAWDKDANKLKALDTTNWRKLDLALDRVLFELRADKPMTTLCVKALEDMVKLIDSLK